MSAPRTRPRWRSTGAELPRGSWPGRIQPMQSSRLLSTDMAPNHPSDQDAAVAALLRRVAATAGVHMYEMELFDDFDYVCHVWIGQALESLLGAVPVGMDKEAAWEACIHPDDRAGYEAALAPLLNGEPTETEYRLVGFDGVTRWVWERCNPGRWSTAGGWWTASSPTSPTATSSSASW